MRALRQRLVGLMEEYPGRATGCLLLVFGIIYSLISLVNHYNFRTYALDLGHFNNAAYNFSHGHAAYYYLSIAERPLINFFGDHFSPVVVLLSPFQYLFGSYTFLILQIAFILIGAYGVYRYASEQHEAPLMGILLMLHFCLGWGIYESLAFDFHTNVLAAMLLPWLMLYSRRNQSIPFILVWLLMISCKENTALWTGFVLAGLIWMHYSYHSRSFRILATVLALLSVVYFVVVVGDIMPSINGGDAGHTQLGKYNYIGGSISEIIHFSLSHPIQMIRFLYEDLHGQIAETKVEFIFVFLFCGGYLIFLRPGMLLMLLPLIGMKMLSNDSALWGVNGHYSIEYIPMISIAFSEVLANLKRRRARNRLIGIMMVTACYGCGFVMTPHRSSYSSMMINWTDRSHYHSDLNIAAINDAISTKIPDKAVVSVHTRLAPHLAMRPVIYHFPYGTNGDYIALLSAEHGTYPLFKEDYEIRVERIKKDTSNWQVIHDADDLLILKRKR